MINKTILYLILISVLYTETNYLWPTNTSNSITTLFGEKRSRRFHAGIDVRTFGKIGDKIFAVETGYISRIKISSDGYGKAIYLKLIDGNTVLYAHLDKFSDSIEKIVENIQIEQNNSFVDKYFKENKYIVHKGDIIGFCGDTGSLSGPHLHFEIRDKNNNPINPLTLYYSLEDTLKPIAESLAFIPLNKNCFINGKQDYQIINLEPLKYDGISTVYKYFIQDTISIIGNFGIAINTYDKINNSPFKFGIYEIEMLIDNKQKYKINFDKYSFNEDPLIYKEIDFNLHTELSENFHRLFNSDTLNFIKNSYNGLSLDKNFHNLIINISDNFHNKIQVQGIIKGDFVSTPDGIFNQDECSLQFEKPIENIDFTLSTRYNQSREIPITYSLYDSTYYKFEVPQKPYEVLKYFIKKDGIKSHPTYLSLFNYDPFKISGKFSIKHLDKNILIKFTENEFSGYDAKLALVYSNNEEKIINLTRLNKNILSSGLLEISDMKNVTNVNIIYETLPEIIFSETINGKILYKNKSNYHKLNNFSLSLNKESLYNDLFVWSKPSNSKISNKYTIISDPINIFPENIPFKEKINLSYSKNNKGGIFKLNKKDKWIYISTSSKDSLNTKITSGGTFAILDEKNKPIISNIFPNYNSEYDLSDISNISFNIIDNESGINHDSIEIVLNNSKLFYDYIPYRNFTRAKINNELNVGKNTLSITCKDNIGNTVTTKGSFFIK